MKKVQIIPLGGLGEIGKNMTVVRYEDDLFIIDAGVAFPDGDMLGVDAVIPDFDYLRKNREHIKAMIVTHGHEDHIGALPHFLKEFQVPVYTTKLTAALIRNKLKNAKGVSIKQLHIVDEKSKVKLGSCEISFFATNHSIPDAVGVVVTTPIGSVVHTGDFKIDYTPIDKKYIDFQRIGEIGRNGVLALLSDSTNAEKPGVSISEKTVGKNLEDVIRKSEGRVIVATFASSLHRVQNLIDIAHRLNKKITAFGRSMENNVKIASKLGYLTIPEGVFLANKEIKEVPRNELIILTTGAQGEPSAGLYRMASGEHSAVEIEEKDTVIFSSSPIPGNEKSVGYLINTLLRKRANVIHKGDIHTSGHGNQDEQKLMLSILRPKYFIPVHGEYRMLMKHGEIAQEVGVEKENIHLCDNGDVIEITEKGLTIVEKVQAGPVLVDGSGLGDVDISVMRDRKRLANHGVAVINANIEGEKVRVNIVLKGIVAKYDKNILNKALAEKISSKIKEGKHLGKAKKELYEEFAEIIHKQVKRKPMIIFLFNIAKK